MDGIEMLPIQRVIRKDKRDAKALVIKELPLTIILNRRELMTLLCTPVDLKYLAIGFLFSEGWLKSKEELKKITVDDQRGVVRVETGEDKRANGLPDQQLITSGGGRRAFTHDAVNLQDKTKVNSQLSVPASRLLALAKRFQHKSHLFRATGGVHSAALYNERGILAFSEDIGRYNAIDKVLGKCILDCIPMAHHVIITSGRVSSEVVLKIARMNVPVLVSRSAPTDRSVKLAADSGITLIGFARGDKMNIYSGGWRIVTDARE